MTATIALALVSRSNKRLAWIANLSLSCVVLSINSSALVSGLAQVPRRFRRNVPDKFPKLLDCIRILRQRGYIAHCTDYIPGKGYKSRWLVAKGFTLHEI